jgi:hypothetical protein
MDFETVGEAINFFKHLKERTVLLNRDSLFIVLFSTMYVRQEGCSHTFNFCLMIINVV